MRYDLAMRAINVLAFGAAMGILYAIFRLFLWVAGC